ncbi:ABC transporter I family member 1, putative, partial [Plasmodium malariae]
MKIHSLEIYNNFSENDKVDLNDTIRQYVLFLSNELCSKEIGDTVYVNHICVTPENEISKSFLSYAEENGLNIFQVYKNEEECLKNVKYAIQLKPGEVKKLKKKKKKRERHNEDNLKGENKSILLNKLKNNIRHDDSLNLDDLYRNVYSSEQYDNILNLQIDENTIKQVKKLRLYKLFIRDIKNLKDENKYKDFFSDEKKKLFFFNFVKSNLIETNLSCGLLDIEKVSYVKKNNNNSSNNNSSSNSNKLSFSYVYGRRGKKPSKSVNGTWEDHDDTNTGALNSGRSTKGVNSSNSALVAVSNNCDKECERGKDIPSAYPREEVSREEVNSDEVNSDEVNSVEVNNDEVNSDEVNSAELDKADVYEEKGRGGRPNNFIYNYEKGIIKNVSYKIRVGDYALLSASEKYFFNDININLKQNFISFNTVDDLSFNVYFNEWYYSSFFIVLEYQFNLFLLQYNADMLEREKSNRWEMERGEGSIHEKDKKHRNNEGVKISLNDFFVYKMPIKSMKINAFDTLEKNIFRV